MDDGTEANIGELGRGLLRRWKLFALVTLSVIGLVMAVTFLIPPVYESEAVLRVRSQEQPGGSLEDLLPIGDISLPGMGGGDVETEVGVLASRRIADLVADSVSLHVELLRPWKAQRSEVVDIRRAGQDAARGTYTFLRQSDGSYSVAFEPRDDEDRAQVPERVQIGQEFEAGNMVLALRAELAMDPPSEVRLRVRPFQRVVSDLRDDLYIARQDSRSQLIDVSYRHRDPQIAAGVVNGTIDYFLEYSRGSERHESRRTAEILSEQVARYQIELAQAEQRLQAFQEQERIIAPEEQATQQVRRVAEVQAARDALRVERAALSTLIARVGTNAADTAEPPYRQLATFPSFISNGAVQDVLQTLTELQNDRAELLGRRTLQNQDVQVLDRRIEELEDQLFAVGTNYLQGLDYQIASAEATLAEFGRELQTIPAVEVEYARLVRERELLSEVYLMLQGRLRETTVQEAIDDATVRVVDYGLVTERPAFPRPLVSLVLASVLGLMAGMVAAIGYDAVNPSVTSRRDAERAAPGVPVVGMIPPLRAVQPRGKMLADRVRGGPLAIGGSRDAREGLVARNDPWHPASEAYRALASGLFANGGSTRQSLVITSAQPEAGKSHLAANLAITLARGGTRTLLMDGDLRAGRLAELFGTTENPGWTQCVLRNTPVSECLREVSVGASGRSLLHLMPAGRVEVHPSEVINSSSLRALLDELRRNYDVVLIDTPPLQPVFDAATFAGFADATLLVVRSGATARDALEYAANELSRAHASIAGVVLTDYEQNLPASAYLRPRQASSPENA